MTPVRFPIAGLLGTALLLGCEPANRTFEIVEIRTRELSPAALAGPAPDRTGRDIESPPMSDAPGRFDYDLPDGWVAGRPSAMRDVDLRAPGGVAIHVTALAGRAGGALANLARWRTQLGLAAPDDRDLAGLPRERLLGEPAHRVDLVSAEGTERLVGLIACSDGGSTFVRMSGPPDAVAEELDAFDDFVASLRVDGATSLRGSAGDATSPSRGDLAWTAPAAWLALPPSPFRLAHFQVAHGVEAWISVLAGDGGGTAANLARWCEQYGRDPMTTEAIAALPRLDVLGRDALLVDLTGPVGTRGMLGVICELETRSVFAKMEGPSEAVRAHAEAFRDFCATLTVTE